MATTMSGKIKQYGSLPAVLLVLCWSPGSGLAQDPSSEGPGGGSTQSGQAGGGQVGGGPANPKASRSARRASQPSSIATERRGPSSRKRSQPEETVSEKVERALDEGNTARDGHLYPQAETFYRQVLSLDARDARAYIGLGNIYFDQEKYDQAIEYYRLAI